MSNDTPLKRGNSRVFIIENRAGPEHTPEYLDWAAAGAIEQAFGDSTRIEVPSPLQYGQYDVVGEILGAIESPTLPLTFQRRFARSRLLELAKRRCPYDVQVHWGACRDPRDFDEGWDLIDMIEAARATNISTEDLGSLTSGDEEKITEEVEESGLEHYQVVPMTYAKRAEAEITAQVIAVEVCDKPSCGDCDVASDGCQVVFAVTDPAGSSPGLLPEVVYTDDGLTTAGDTPITTMGAGDNPDDAVCVGQNLVVVSQDTVSLHWADKDDILDGTDVWAEVTAGFVALHGPRCIDSYSPRDSWIGGAGGYIYFTTNPVDGVDVQDAGVATTEDLNDIAAISAKVVVAVGDNNAVVYTLDGGDTWANILGPVPAVNLNCVALRTEKEWWIGTAAGEWWYTLDQGEHWAEKAFPGGGTGSVEDAKWASDSVGFMSHITAGGVGRILRTISGGNTWYVQPEANLSMPTQAGFLSIDVCQRETNVLYAGGRATGAVDGVLVKGTGS